MAGFADTRASIEDLGIEVAAPVAAEAAEGETFFTAGRTGISSSSSSESERPSAERNLFFGARRGADAARRAASAGAGVDEAPAAERGAGLTLMSGEGQRR